MTLACFVCGKKLKTAIPDETNLPFGATINLPFGATVFKTYGNYGSTVFDPMDQSFLELNICDECLIKNRDLVLRGKYMRPPITEAEYTKWVRVDGEF
jgi:hypothetical protein